MSDVWGQLLRPMRVTRPDRRPALAAPDTKPPKLKVGDKVGQWTLLEYHRSKRPDHHPRWLARCSCGVEREVQTSNLTSGSSRSCGHDRPNPPVRERRYVPGDKVGEWTLLDYHPGARSPRVMPSWTCQCSCGETRRVSTHNLASGASKSCGHAHARFNRWEGYQPVTQ